MRLSVYIALASCLLGLSIAKWPAGIVSCPKSDRQKYNQCLNALMKKVHPHMANGIKEANLPKLDPYELSNFTVNHDAVLVKAFAKASNIRVIGATNFKVLELTGDPDKLTLHLKVNMPLVNSFCDYDTKGSLLGFPINMKGHFQGNFNNTVVTADGVGEAYKDKGVMRLKVKSLTVKVHVGNGQIKLDAAGKSQTVARAIQNLFNSSPRTVLDVLTPIFEKSAIGIIRGLLDNALKTFTKDELIVPN